MRLGLSLALIAVAVAMPARAQQPVIEDVGRYVCSVDLAAIADTNWHDYASTDAFDATAADGTACPAGAIVAVSIYMESGTSTARFALGSREAGDAATNALPCPIGGSNFVATRGLRGAGSGVRTVSVKLSNAADVGYLTMWVVP